MNLKSIKNYIQHPQLAGLWIVKKWFQWLPDRLYLKLRYQFETGEKLHLKNPITFNEKLQWLKLYDRKEIYTKIVDKYSVKKIVSDKIGDSYVIPTLGLWKNFEEIDFKILPKQFVLKTTHGGGGGGVAICTDKASFDIEEARKKINTSLNRDIYKSCKEWPYKYVPKRIIAEQFIQSSDGDLRDYKFFCFNGEPRFLKVDFGRYKEHHANYYDLDWNFLPFGESALPPIESHIEVKPKNFDEMCKIARTLSKETKFLRVDLYNVDGKIYFGEMTFYPASGMGHFTSTEWEIKVGDMLNLI